jgi:hypothetical protein
MEPEGSSPYTQEPATCPCLEPDRSNLCLPNLAVDIVYVKTINVTVVTIRPPSEETEESH